MYGGARFPESTRVLVIVVAVAVAALVLAATVVVVVVVAVAPAVAIVVGAGCLKNTCRAINVTLLGGYNWEVNSIRLSLQLLSYIPSF